MGFQVFSRPNRAPERSKLIIIDHTLEKATGTQLLPTQMIYYEGDKIPLLKDKFIVGSYSGIFMFFVSIRLRRK